MWNKPLDLISVDIIRWLQKSNEYELIISIADTASTFLMVYSLRKGTEIEFLHRIQEHYGYPSQILTDNGT